MHTRHSISNFLVEVTRGLYSCFFQLTEGMARSHLNPSSGVQTSQRWAVISAITLPSRIWPLGTQTKSQKSSQTSSPWSTLNAFSALALEWPWNDPDPLALHHNQTLQILVSSLWASGIQGLVNFPYLSGILKGFMSVHIHRGTRVCIPLPKPSGRTALNHLGWHCQ